MTTREELELVIKLIKKHNLPLSPILEYAIKDKLAPLTSTLNDSGLVQEYDSRDNLMRNERKTSYKSDIKRGKKSFMRVIRDDGSVIENMKSTDTMIQVIKEIGADRVYELRIPHYNDYLVTREGHPYYPKFDREVGNGFYVNMQSSNDDRKMKLEKIFDALGMNWRVEIEK